MDSYKVQPNRYQVVIILLIFTAIFCIIIASWKIEQKLDKIIKMHDTTIKEFLENYEHDHGIILRSIKRQY